MSSTTIPIQIRVDRDTRDRANMLFEELGTNMSGAINIFLKQCVNTGGIPFRIRKSRYSEETEEAIREAEELLKDPNTPKYETMKELIHALEAE